MLCKLRSALLTLVFIALAEWSYAGDAINPGRAVIVFRESAGPSVLSPALESANERLKATGMEPLLAAPLRPAAGPRLQSLAPTQKSRIAQLEGLFSRTYIVEFDPSIPFEEARRAYAADPQVEAVYPDGAPTVEKTLNDPSLPGVWGHAKIQAAQAWDLTEGQGIIVAVSDSGVDRNHPDLAANIWQNPGEIAGNGVDDDKNGFVDDTYGWDFYNRDNNPSGSSAGKGYHGTHVAGTIAAVGNNGVGFAGIAHRARILSVQGFPDNGGSGSETHLGRGILYATAMGAHVINMSWGGSGPSVYIDYFLEYAHLHGVVLVCSAGNSNADAAGQSPANSRFTIAVAATDSGDNKASFSNWGTKVDVAAPGVSVYSTMHGGGYANLSGTSMASPHAAGVAALLLSSRPGLSPEEVRQWLRQSAEDLGAPGRDIYFGDGRINAHRAAAGLEKDGPRITILRPLPGEEVQGTVRITGTAEDLSPVVSLSAWVDGVKVAQGQPGAGWAMDWAAALPVGDHSLEVRAEDAQGNVGRSPTQTVRIVNAPAPTAPTAASLDEARPMRLRLAWSGAGGSVTGYRVDVSLQSDFSQRLADYDGLFVPGAGTTSLDLIGLAPGTRHYARVRAEGPGGLSAHSPSATAQTLSGLPNLKVETFLIGSFQQPLTRLLVNPRITNAGQPFDGALAAEADLLKGGAVLETVYSTSVVRSLGTGESFATFFNFHTPAFEGPYTLRVRADPESKVPESSEADNVLSLPFSVDGTPPGLTVATPAPNAALSGVVAVAGQASDAGSGIGSVSLFVDNALVLSTSTTGSFGFSLDTSAWPAASTHTLLIVARDKANLQAQVAIPVSKGSGGAPPAPKAPQVSGATTQSLNVDWEPVPGATGYRLDASLSPAFSSFLPGYQNRDMGAATAALLSGLSPGTTYFARVRAVNAAGAGPNSPVGQGVTAVVEPPPPPGNVRFEGASADALTVRWDAVPAAQNYRLDLSTQAAFASYWPGYQDRSVGNVLAWTAAGLKEETVYYARLRAAGPAGTSPHSAVASASTLGLPDLTVLELVPTRSLLLPGEKFGFSVRVRNAGRGPGLAPVRVQTEAIPAEMVFSTGILQGGQEQAHATPPQAVTAPAQPGVYRLRAQADWLGIVREADESNNERTAEYLVDGSAPTVSFLSPADGDAISGVTEIRAAASDDWGVSVVRLWLDGTLLGADGEAPYVWSWNPASAADGPHTLRLEAEDRAGRKSLAVIGVRVTRDDAAVSYRISPPASLVTRQRFYVYAQMTNTGLNSWTKSGGYALIAEKPALTTRWGAPRIELGTSESVAPGKTRTFYATTYAPATPGTYSFAYRMARSSSSFGAWAHDQSIPVVADQSPPTSPSSLRAQSPAPDRILAEWNSSYDNAGVAEYLVDAALDAGFGSSLPGWQNRSVGTARSALLTGLSSGSSVFLRVRAVDVNGLVSAPSPVLQVRTLAAPDTVKPAVSITAPGAGQRVEGWVTIHAAAADAHSGVRQVSCRVNGVLLGTDRSAPYQIWWSAQGLSGPQTLTAEATDHAGNVGISAPVTVTVGAGSAAAPLLSGVLGGPGVNADVELGGGPLSLTASADDPVSVQAHGTTGLDPAILRRMDGDQRARRLIRASDPVLLFTDGPVEMALAHRGRRVSGLGLYRWEENGWRAAEDAFLSSGDALLLVSEPGLFAVLAEDAPEPETARVRVSPNPVRGGRAAVVGEVGAADWVRLSVLNVQGLRVREAEMAPLLSVADSGETVYREDVDFSGLPSGVYLAVVEWSVKGQVRRKTHKVAVLR